MTEFAAGGEAQTVVVRIRSRIVVSQVTAHACGRAPLELPVSMAVQTQRLFMLPLKHERGVRKLGPFPGCVLGAVADGAVGRKSGGHVVRLLGTLVLP